MNKETLAIKIFNIARIEGDFLLRSGARSNVYFDKYRFESNPEILSAIADQMIPLIGKRDFDYLAGLEMGGIPIATAISLKTGIEVVYVRKKAKDYGTEKFAEGPDIKGKKLLLVEDVITSGGQAIISANDLRQAGAFVDRCIAVIDRQSGGSANMAKENISLNTIFTMSYIEEMAKS